jgi:PAS domain S-box-containing protein
LNQALEAATLIELIEAASQGVLVIDERGLVLLVNQKTEELFGFGREELIGKGLDVLLPAVTRESHNQFVGEYFRKPRKRPMGIGMDLAGRRKDGTEFPLEISLSYLDRNSGRLALALITDITDRKRLEERLLEAQRLETAGLLAGGVAHDFNNLLVGVMGNASLVLENMSADDPSRPLMESLIKSSERAAELTRQLLAYAGKARFVMKPLNLNRIIQDLQPAMNSMTPRHVTLRIDLAHELAPVEADAALMRQVVLSLFTNAVESIPEDHPGSVRVRTYEEDGRVCLRIEDTGRGMDAETQARVFDPFFTTKFMGRGLGLSAALGIVRSHGGDIHVKTSPGRGSAFSVRLPSQTAQAAAPQPVPAPGLTQVVLVVDDEEVVRNLARAALERRGYIVLTASNGQEAIEVLHQHRDRVSIVLLDLTMPVMSGEETLGRLRKVRPDIPVVLTSGYSEIEAMRLFGGKGLAGFIQKPYPPARLAEALRNALGGAAASR